MPHNASLAIARHAARRSARSAALWGAVFGGTVTSSAVAYSTSFPPGLARTRLVASFSGNAGIAALIGPAHNIDTVAGFTAWRVTVALAVIGSVWGVLTATRLLRGEEDAGRWELIVAGPVTRGGAAAAVLAGLAVGWLVMLAVSALLAVAAGANAHVRFAVTGSLFLALTVSAAAAMFLAIGAVTSQLATTRRQANVLGGAILGTAYLVRMVADSSRGLRWLRWASPIGWVENLRPLTGSRLVPLVPIAALAAGAAVAATRLATRRDLGDGTLPRRDAAAPRTALLGGPTGLTVRLTRSVAIGWIVATALSGLVFGLVAQSAANAVSGSDTIARALARLGGTASGAAAYLGLTFLMAASLVAFAAAGFMASARSEEAEGRIDNLFTRPVARRRWLGGRVVVAGVAVTVASVVAGLAAWVGAASQHSGLAFGALVQAGVNVAPPALLVVGLGALTLGVAPRWTTTVTYGVVAWSFLVTLIAAAVTTNRWILDSSLFHHIRPAPAAAPNWTGAAWLAGLGIAASLVGIAAFNRRDLASA